METYRFRSGSTRLLVSIPHAGTFLPPDIADDMTEVTRAVPDTDWHVDRLYDFLDDMDATVLVATHSRYVVDLNRPPDGTSLYPGQTETGICPLETFDGQPIYQPRREPDVAAIRERIRRYWQPYHDQLKQELDRLRAQQGSAVLWDAHSIRSRLPRLFDGELPVLNFGTNDGRSCDAALTARLFDHARAVPGCTAVLNGRFKGGYITRRYGDPANGIHAVQLELAQRSYMDEALPYTFLSEQAAQIRPVLRTLLEIAVAG